MPSNALDEIITAFQRRWEEVGLRLTPLTIATTLFIIVLPFILLLIFALTQKETHLPPPAGCRKIGLKGRSNLYDQYSKQYAKGVGPTSSSSWSVKALFIYPVKSCRGVELEKADVIRTGFQYDRQFAIGQYYTGLPNLNGKVESEWRFITQRTFPRLAKVESEIWVPDPSVADYDQEGEWVKNGGCMIIRFPFTPDTDYTIDGLKNYARILAAYLAGKPEPMVEIRLPFRPSKDCIKKKAYKKEVLRVWDDTPVALNMGCEVDKEALAKLKYTLGVTNPITIFRIDNEKYREVYSNAPKQEDVGFQTIIAMQDSYPLHIINLASVHHLASQLPKNHGPLSARRFRANIFMTGPPAFHEDDWTKARIGNTLMHISCRTTRCKLPNVDPETAIPDRNEPYSTMRRYRIIDEGNKKNPCLGMQVTPLELGEVKVGDTIELLTTGKHFHLS